MANRTRRNVACFASKQVCPRGNRNTPSHNYRPQRRLLPALQSQILIPEISDPKPHALIVFGLFVLSLVLLYLGFDSGTASTAGTATPPPAVLYHYCSASSLKGIVEGKQLWATSACFLNDPSEWSWLTRVAIGLLNENYNTARPARRIGARRNVHHELLRLLEDVGQRSYERVGVFIVSLSEKHNDLSQWRAYADDAQGYCIGFSTSDLPIAPKKVVYSLERQRQIVGCIVERIIGDPSKPNSEWGAESCASMMMGMQPLMKHYCYEQEAEWRLVSQAELISTLADGRISHPKATSVGIRLRGEAMIPYIPIPLSLKSIVSVTIGPRQPEPEATQYALRLLLARNGFTGADIQILSSAVPYRGS